MKECNIRFDKNGKVKSEDIKNLEKFFSEENLEKFESDEVFAVEATEHIGNGEYKAVGYDFYIGSKIFNQEVYDALVQIRKESKENFDETSAYFPLYRA